MKFKINLNFFSFLLISFLLMKSISFLLISFLLFSLHIQTKGKILNTNLRLGS